MKVVIFGGTGFIGRALVNVLSNEYHDITIVTRNAGKAKQNFGSDIHFVEWDMKDSSVFTDVFTGEYVIINLAGENVGSKIWTKKQKDKILKSRLTITNKIAEIVDNTNNKPEAIIQASAIGFYGSSPEKIYDESSPKGEGFLAYVTYQWEKSLQIKEPGNIRVIYIRIGLVLGYNAGFIGRLKIPFKLYLGGHIGNGKQWMSWIHIRDVAGAIKFLLQNKSAKGIYNLTVPDPVRSREFFSVLGHVLSRPSWLHVPAFLLKILPGNMAEELFLVSANVVPARLNSSGYKFHYPDLKRALDDILKSSDNE
jgi:uncharacterized protein (TIGR01777 family)